LTPLDAAAEVIGMRWLLCFLALALCACSHRPKGPDGQPLWFEVQTGHFVLRAATDEPTARAAAARLERVREALLAGSWHARVELPGKVQVVLLEDDDALQAQLPRGTAGLTTQDGLGQLIIFASAQQDIAAMPVLKHELSHVVSHQFLLRSPLWLSEGLAVYLETLRLHGDSATLGYAHPEAAESVRRAGFDFAAVLTAGPEVYLGSLTARQDFYSKAWLLVHMLANLHREALDGYLARLARAEDPQAAFAASFPGLTPAALQDEAQKYFHHGEYRALHLELPPQQIELQVRTLRPAEVRATEAQFVSAASGLGGAALRAQAEIEARAALALDPGEPLAALVLCETTGGQSAPCAQAARAVVKAHPDDPRGFLLLAAALRLRRTDPERGEAIERAATLAPEDPSALVGLVDLRLSQQRLPEAREAAMHANRNAPGRAEPLDALATVLAAEGQCDAAVAAEKRVLEVLPDRAPPSAAAEVSARIEELGLRCAEMNQAREQARIAAIRPSVPRRLACAGDGPRLPRLKFKRGTTVSVRYKVRADGAVADVTPTAEAPRALLDAVIEYVSSCRFEPARREGQAIEVEMEEYFQLQPAPR
jgi:tetratricopeptide (TPR) repeat protein